MSMLDDDDRRLFPLGQNPAVGSAHGKMQRLGLAHLKWLVVRDLNLIESATFWKDSPEIETGELSTTEIDTEVFFFPAAAHVEKDGSFTQTQRMLQWHHKAVEPPGRCAERPAVLLPPRARSSGTGWPTPPTDRDRPLLDLTWDYPGGRARRGLRRGGAAGDQRLAPDRRDAGQPLKTFTEMKDDGSTARRLLDLHRGLRRRCQPAPPGADPAGSSPGWRRSGAGPGR